MVHTTPHTRRGFVSGLTAGMGVLLGACNRTAPETAATPDTGKADVTLRIGPVLVDIAKDHTISTLGYNGKRSRSRDPDARGRAGGRGFIQRHRFAGVGPLARPDYSGRRRWRGGGKEPGSAGERTPAVSPDSAAGGSALGALARHADVGSEPRNVYRPVWIRLHRTQERARRLRSGNLPGDA